MSCVIAQHKYTRLDIQGLRAIAVIAVVSFHAGLPLHGGFAGVDVFFVISGYVIASMLARQMEEQGFISLAEFYTRRFYRLMPALSLLVTTTAVFAALVLTPLMSELIPVALTGIGAVLMTSNIVIATRTGGYFQPTAESNPLLNMWSLSVEEQFYIFFPFLLLVAFGFRNKRYLAHLLICSVGVVSFGFMMVGSYSSELSTRLQLLIGFYSPLSRAWEFCAGALLAIICKRNDIMPYWLSNSIGYIGITLIFYSLVEVGPSDVWPGIKTLYSVSGSVLVIYAGLGKYGKYSVSAILSHKALVGVGNASYSWYLWHWPLMVFSVIIFGRDLKIQSAIAILSLVPAILSYQIVEKPILSNYKKIQSKIVSVILITIVPIVAWGGILYASANGYWNDKILSYQSIVQPLHASNARGCGQGFVPLDLNDESCTWNGTGANNPFYLIGDSNADHMSEAVIRAGQYFSSAATIVTKGGCSFIGEYWSDRSDSDSSRCNKFNDDVIDGLKSARTGIVILGMSDSIWRTSGLSIGPSREMATRDLFHQQSYLYKELELKVKKIQSYGHVVILLLPVPKFVTIENKLLFDPKQCNILSILDGRCPFQISISLENQEKLQYLGRQAIANVSKSTGSQTIDLRSLICDGQLCNIMKDGELLYRDSGHLSVQTSNKLGPDLVRQLEYLFNPKK